MGWYEGDSISSFSCSFLARDFYESQKFHHYPQQQGVETNHDHQEVTDTQ